VQVTFCPAIRLADTVAPLTVTPLVVLHVRLEKTKVPPGTVNEVGCSVTVTGLLGSRPVKVVLAVAGLPLVVRLKGLVMPVPVPTKVKVPVAPSEFLTIVRLGRRLSV
jgi:hypothetical protein